MRTSPLLLVALFAACDPYAENTPGDSDTTGGAEWPDADDCSETYVVPGLAGAQETSVQPDAHADVFGTEEQVGTNPADGVVGPDPRHVRIGWPSADTSTSISFVWSTDSATLSSVVELAEGTDLTGEVTRYEGVSFRYGGTSGDRFRVHELKLCGRLTPNTTYTYRVGGEGHWSSEYTFTTPGAPGSFDTFKVAISGDSRGSYEEWATLVQRMEAEDPDFYLFSGDMVELGPNQNEWYAWFEAAGDVFAEKVLVPAHGNHEFLASNYFAQFSLPNNEQWFSVDYGTATILSLNDTVADPAHRQFDQPRFIDEKLGASTATWKLTMHHIPMYSTCTRHGSDEQLRDFWQPVFDDVDVDFDFSGHNHIYERSVPVKGEGRAADGTVYFVTGGAGAPLYEQWSADWFNATSNPVEHYIVAEFAGTTATFTVKDISGNVIDAYTVSK